MSVNVKMQGESHELVEQSQFGRTTLWSGNQTNTQDEMTLTLSDYPSNYDVLVAYQNYYGVYPIHVFDINELSYGNTVGSASFGTNQPTVVRLKLAKDSKEIKATSFVMNGFGSYGPASLVRIVGIKLGGGNQ